MYGEILVCKKCGREYGPCGACPSCYSTDIEVKKETNFDKQLLLFKENEKKL